MFNWTKILISLQEYLFSRQEYLVQMIISAIDLAHVILTAAI